MTVFLHAVFAGPIEADFMTIEVVQVCVPPAPPHHALHLRNVEVLRLQLARQKLSSSLISKYQRTTSLASEVPHPAMCSATTSPPGARNLAVHRFAFVAVLVHQLESQQVTIKTWCELHILDVYHGVIEAELVASFWNLRRRGLLGPLQ